MSDEPNIDPDKDPAKKAGKEIDVEAIVEARVAEALTGIKENLDRAYTERDTLAKKLASMEEEQKQKEIKRLEEDGEDLKAAQLKISSLEGTIEALKKENTSLTRDRIVGDATTGLEFLNETSKSMATKAIMDQLVQDKDGNWVHKSGASISDFVKTFAKEESNAFLFKQKTSSGSPSMRPGHPSSNSEKPEWTKLPVSQWTSKQMFEALEKGYDVPGLPKEASFNL